MISIHEPFCIRWKMFYGICHHPLCAPSRVVPTKDIAQPTRQNPFWERIIDKNCQMRTAFTLRDFETHSIAADHNESRNSDGLPNLPVRRRSLSDDLLHKKRESKNLPA